MIVVTYVDGAAAPDRIPGLNVAFKEGGEVAGILQPH